MTEQTASGVNLSPEEIQAFAECLDGELITPTHEQYDLRRAVWNGMIDRRPALIARCASVADVQASVDFARLHQLSIAVRGGGHNVAGHATIDGGLVIDLSRMKRIELDPAARTARVEGGVTWGELDAVAQVHGLATPGGVFSGTGIAGLTLGGGFGWLRNKHGLSCDNLIAAEVVMASGQIMRASEEENFDLLWGLRGGGGNFGIVTSFIYRLHPVGPEVMFALVFHDGRGEKMKQAVRFYREYCKQAPDEVSSIGFAGIFPPGVEHYPVEIQGLPFFAIGALYAGPVEEGQRILQPLRDFMPPMLDMSGVVPYVDAQKAFDADYPDGKRYYWKSINLTHLDDEVIDVFIAHARRQPSPLSTTDLWHIGGVVKRVSTDESAFFGRQAAFLVNPEANWEDRMDDAANLTWVRKFIAALKPYSDGSRYLNFAGFQEEGEEMMMGAYGPQYRRLKDLKRKYDPDNLFSLNQNIPPSIL